MLAGLEFGQQLLDVLLNLGFAMNVSRCIYVNLSKGVSERNLSLMFPVFLAELRPLFFRYRLRRDKDESVEFEFNFLAPHPGFAFR